MIGHSDQGGRPDGVQLMVNKGFAYHRPHVLQGLQRRRRPRSRATRSRSRYVAAPPNTWNIHLQTHGDLLLVINAKDMFAAAEFQDERAYYKGALGKKVGTAAGRDRAGRATGPPAWRSTTSPSPAEPRQIGFMPVEGGGVHRIWYTGGRWAYCSALLDGFTDYIFMTHRHGRPDQAGRAGRWWIPGMNTGGRRDARLAGRRAATACTTRSCTATPPTAPGATPAWSCSTSPTARRPS